MKYDCSKVLDFKHERNRMCDSYAGCLDGCPLYEKFCYSTQHLTQEHINIVQKWSDEHPKKTRKEAFREIFPHIRSFDPQSICFKNLIGFDFGSIVTECAEIGCVGCWNEPYAGEFEKAREE